MLDFLKKLYIRTVNSPLFFGILIFVIFDIIVIVWRFFI